MECPKCLIVFPDSFDKCPKCGTPAKIADSPGAASSGKGAEKPGAIRLDDEPTFGPQAPGASSDTLSSRYRIEAELDHGGTSTVCIAADNRIRGRKVAIKRIKQEAFDSSGEPAGKLKSAILKEMETLAQLQHHNIVHVFDVGMDSEGLYMVMEYVDGGTLKEIIARDGPLGAEKVAGIGEQLSSALTVVHDGGFVHRDLKPANVLLTRRGMPKLADFGLALNLKDDRDVRHETILGTFSYMSPEQRKNSNRVDPASDIYSLGATLYAAATGESPDRPDAEKLPELIRKPIMKAMEENPSDRFQSAREFQEALRGTLAMGKPPEPSPKTESYPCYRCGKPVATNDRHCSECGENLLEARSRNENLFHDGMRKIDELAARQDYEAALNELDKLARELNHEHFAHFGRKAEEKAQSVRQAWERAKAQELDLEQRLREAVKALEEPDLDKASKTASEIAACREPYCRRVVQKAQEVLDSIQAIHRKRRDLEARYEKAEKSASECVLRGDFEEARAHLIAVMKDFTERDRRLYDQLSRNVEGKLAWVNERAAKTGQLRNELLQRLKDAGAALERLELETAKILTDELAGRKEAHFQDIVREARTLKGKIEEIEKTRKTYADFLADAEKALTEDRYSSALALLEKILASTHEAYSIARAKALTAKERCLAGQSEYERKRRAESMRQDFLGKIAKAKKDSRNTGKILEPVLGNKDPEFADLRLAAASIIRRHKMRRALVPFLALILLIAAAASVSRMDMFKSLRDDVAFYAQVAEIWIYSTMFGEPPKVQLFDKPAGTARTKAGAHLYTDTTVVLRGERTKASEPVKVGGVVRTRSNSVWALQTESVRGQKPLYIRIDDIDTVVALNENGSYLEILLNSEVFRRNGKTNAEATRKQLDTYIRNHSQSESYADIMVDYLSCLEWRFDHDLSVNKDAVVELARITGDKLNRRFPGSAQSGQYEKVLERLEKARR